MLFELIAVLAAGFAAAGVFLLLGHLSAGALPRWLAPVAAGVAMISYTIYSEYSWYGRTQGGLPESIVVIRTAEDRAAFRPWTYVLPYVNRFMAVDQASIRRNASVPDQRILDLYAFGRWSPVRQIPVLVDCAGARQAPLVEGVEFNEDGTVDNARWEPADPDGALVAAACSEA